MLSQLRFDKNDCYLGKLNGLAFCLLVLLLSRLTIYLEAYSAHFFLEISKQANNYYSWFVHWDSGWYLNIIEHGYAKGPVKDFTNQQNWAFFPLYPLSVKLIGWLIPINPILLGQILSTLYFSLAVVCFYLLLKRYFSESNCRFGVLLLCFSPFNIYFVSIYTESLFLWLSLIGILLAYQKRWLLACISGALLSATRPNGIMMGLPFLFIFYQQWRAAEVPLIKVIYMGLIPLGLMSYMIFLYFHTGDAIAFIHIEAAWGRAGWHWGWENILRTIGLFVGHTYNFIVFVISLWLIIYTYRKKYTTEVLYYFAMVFPALASGDSHSLARYTASIYTFYFGLVIFCRRDRLRKTLVLATSLALLAIYIIAWIKGYGGLT